MNDTELAWLAGLYEGEGSTSKHGGLSYHITIAMTDQDVLERAQQITGLGRVYGPYAKRSGWKDIYSWVCNEHDSYTIMRLIKPFMLARRAAQIDEAIHTYETRERQYVIPAELKLSVIEDRKIGLSQWDLAGKHGISRSAVQQILQANGLSGRVRLN